MSILGFVVNFNFFYQNRFIIFIISLLFFFIFSFFYFKKNTHNVDSIDLDKNLNQNIISNSTPSNSTPSNNGFSYFFFNIKCFLFKVKPYCFYIYLIITFLYAVYLFISIKNINSIVQPINQYSWIINAINRSIVSPIHSNFTPAFNYNVYGVIQSFDLDALKDVCNKANDQQRVLALILPEEKQFLKDYVDDMQSNYQYNLNLSKNQITFITCFYLLIGVSLFLIKNFNEISV